MEEYEKLEYNEDFTEILEIKSEINWDRLDTIPYKIKTIANNALRDEEMKSFPYLPDLQKIGTRAFQLSKIESFAFGPNVKEIGNYAFCNCNSLNNVVLPQNLLSIGKHAFMRTPFNKILVVPETVAEIGMYAFEYTDIESLTIHTLEPIVINERTFSHCANLRNVSLKNVSEIKELAFAGTSIETIILPSSLKILSPTAFIDCENLKKIVIKSSKEDFIKRSILNMQANKVYEDLIEFCPLQLDDLLDIGKSFKEINNMFLDDSPER